MTPPLFKEGDVVRLKCGGPAVTVQSVNHIGIGVFLYECTWFTDKDLKMASFSESTLKRVGWLDRLFL